MLGRSEGASSLNAFCTEFRQLTDLHRFCLCPVCIFSRLRSEPGLRYKGTSLVVESGQMLKRITNEQINLLGWDSWNR